MAAFRNWEYAIALFLLSAGQAFAQGGNNLPAVLPFLNVLNNPSQPAILTGNITPVNTVIQSNGTTVLNAGISQAQAIFGLTSNTGTGQTLFNSNNLTLYTGMVCNNGSRQCWSQNPVITLNSPLSVDFYSASGMEIDFNNFSGTDFNNTNGKVNGTMPFQGPLILTGLGTNDVTYAIDIGGTNVNTGAAMHQRGIWFGDTGARLADLQSDDHATYVFEDFGTHAVGELWNGTYTSQILWLDPTGVATPTGVASTGTYTSALWNDSSTVPTGIFLNGTYSASAINIASAVGGTAMLVGSKATGSATPTDIVMDASYSTTAGANPKLTIYPAFGFGVSAGSFDYMVATGNVHTFYVAGVNVGSIASTGWTIPGTLGVTGKATVTADVSTAAHYLDTSAVPTLSSCGTSPPAATAGSSSAAGQFTVGTGGTVTACTVTFAVAYPTTAFCTVSPVSSTITAVRISAQSKTAFTVTFAPATASQIFQYTCGGN